MARISLLLATWLILVGFCDQSDQTKLPHTSSMKAGTWQRKQKLLFTIQSELDPNAEFEVDYRDIVVSYKDLDITLVEAVESGMYPDASARIANGGPGHSFVTLRLLPGPSKGFKYTVKVFVVKIPLDVEKCYFKHEITYYRTNETESIEELL